MDKATNTNYFRPQGAGPPTTNSTQCHLASSHIWGGMADHTQHSSPTEELNISNEDVTVHGPGYIHQGQANGMLKAQILNVCGLEGKLGTPEFRDALENYDISFFCETHMDDADTEHVQEIIDSINLCAFFKNRKRLMAYRSGGVYVLFKKNLKNYIS